MSANTVDFRLNRGAAETSRRISPNIWADCPILDIVEGNRNGIYFYDDFVRQPLPPTLTTQIAYGAYKAFATSGDTIVRTTTINSVEIPGGALSLTHNTDNNSASIAQYFPSLIMSGATTNSGKLWFECCYAQNAIVTNLASSFVGLFEVDQWTLATAVPLNAGDAITNTASGVGFRIAEDGLGVIDTVITDRATSFTNIGAGEGGTLAAFGFTKLGMVYDPYTDNPARMLRFFVNNLEVATPYSKTQILATTNLKANALGLIWASVADSAGTTFAGYMKWWSVAQVFEPLG